MPQARICGSQRGRKLTPKMHSLRANMAKHLLVIKKSVQIESTFWQFQNMQKARATKIQGPFYLALTAQDASPQTLPDGSRRATLRRPQDAPMPPQDAAKTAQRRFQRDIPRRPKTPQQRFPMSRTSFEIGWRENINLQSIVFCYSATGYGPPRFCCEVPHENPILCFYAASYPRVV